MTSSVATPIDLRTVAPRDRHALVFQRFDALKAGEALELVNDQDPVPLRLQFEERWTGRFDWSAREAGLDQWHVHILKLKAVPIPVAADSCCSGGACCA